MKKCLLLVALLIVSQMNNLKAQTLFNAPDTVCINQPVTLTTNFPNSDSYYWGFCSGYLMNPPSGGSNLGSSFGFSTPSAIDVVRDVDGNYYGFELNSVTQEFLKLNFGNSLQNTPTVTNLGNVTGVLPAFPSSLYVVRDSVDGNWFVFVTGGTDQASSTVGRLDFGHSLSNNVPNIANFGNMMNVFNAPRGIFVAKEGDYWYGYCVNNATSELIRLEFEKNISNTPLCFNVNNPNNKLVGPTDMAAGQDGANWYLFVTNSDNTVAQIVLANTLDDLSPTANTVPNTNGLLIDPSSIALTRDCGNWYAYITDRTSDQLTELKFPFGLGGTSTVTTYSNASAGFGFAGPTAISRILRYHDDLFAFVTNTDNSLSKVVFPQCTSSTIQSSTAQNPPTYIYTEVGTYNIFNIINEGEPTMQVECQLIHVLPPPAMDLTSDTAICEGDTVRLRAITANATSTIWYPDYNLTDTIGNRVSGGPHYSLPYHVVLTFPDGCIIDTPIYVHVSQVRADAGPDRVISDGSQTVLGGPLTSTNGMYQYQWSPPQFLSDTTGTNPVADPSYDFTYYFKVTELNDTLRCTSMDTVVIHTNCGDLYLPNAFAPGTGVAGANTFGILNRQIVKLNYLRVFDRWGKKVFETSDPSQQWDGTINGDKAPGGVYVWEADGFCISGKRFKKAGNVTLLR